MDEQRGVERFFRAEIVWNREKGRVVYLDEQIRNFLLREYIPPFFTVCSPDACPDPLPVRIKIAGTAPSL